MSEPVARVVVPAASAAAEPPEDPPGVYAGFHGLRVTPHSRECVTVVQQNSGHVVRAVHDRSRLEQTLDARRGRRVDMVSPQERASDGQILISEEIAQAITDLAHTTPLGPLPLKGFSEPVPVRAVAGLRGLDGARPDQSGATALEPGRV